MRTSKKTEKFSESVIREMTRLNDRYGAINLAQGFPDLPTPQPLLEAASRAIQEGRNQYSITWGSRLLREAVAEKVGKSFGRELDPDAEVTITCGSTEGMISSLMAVLDPGCEIIIFEPFYENYVPDSILSAAVPRFVTLRGPDWSIDRDELRAAFNSKTRAIILNNPSNPTGKVFSREELSLIADLCLEWDCIAVTDEIYEHIIYDGARHISLATLPGMGERTVTVNGISKTYTVTGWRVGYIVAVPELMAQIRKVHDFLTVCAPTPLQEAAVVGLRFPPEYYEKLAEDYKMRRDYFYETLVEANLRPNRPAGAYYMMAGIEDFGHDDDRGFAEYLVREAGVTCVPGSSFYHKGDQGKSLVRFCFAKRMDTLEEVRERLRKLCG